MACECERDLDSFGIDIGVPFCWSSPKQHTTPQRFQL